jgi:RNA polymerase sigma-70 factor (ECF subfamily)
MLDGINGEPPLTFERLLDLARQGDDEAVGRILQQHRNYLLQIANQEIGNDLKGKVGASDIVQESLLTAHQQFAKFTGEEKEQLLAWLRQILRHDLQHLWRKYKATQKRKLDKEQALQVNSSLEVPLIDPNHTPQTNAMLAEQRRHLDNALTQLPDNYAQVIRLKSFDDMDFAEIGKRMDRSADAARKLWTRAIISLQDILDKSSV